MTLTFHVSLADPAGDNHPGPEFDCPKCRAALLEAFRSPASAAEVRPNKCPFCTGSLNPDLMDHVRNTHPKKFLSWKQHPANRDRRVAAAAPEAETADLYAEPPTAPTGNRTDPFTDKELDPEIQVHETEHGVEEDPDVVGGEWYARCSCGWSDGGTYGHEIHSAGRLAKLRADAHRRRPKKGTDQ